MTRTPIIAIVDDDIQIGKSLAKLLVMMGFRAQFHQSGPEFLFSLGGRIPDCILIDAQMPGTSGMQMMRCIQDMKLNVPMILATGSHDEALWAEAQSYGAKNVLYKPYCVDDLTIKINQVLGCPGFVPNRCPWPCNAIGKSIWNCAFAGFSNQARDFLNTQETVPSPALLTTLAQHSAEQAAAQTRPLTTWAQRAPSAPHALA
jgi:CheY-like chemotaxis protein